MHLSQGRKVNQLTHYSNDIRRINKKVTILLMAVKRLPHGSTEVTKSRNVHFIKHQLKSTKEEDSFWVLPSFDRHHDNPKSDNVMEKDILS